MTDLAASSEKMEPGEAEKIAFREIDLSIPNLIELQAPVQGKVHRTRFFGRDVNWCKVTINDATELTLSLYFQGDFTPPPNSPIHGYIWLTGSIFNSESD